MWTLHLIRTRGRAAHGERRRTRSCYALLTHVGLEELAVQSSADYVACAVTLAGDLDRLDQLHVGLRARMEGSAIRDQEGYMRALEREYVNAPKDWHEGERS